MGEPISVDEIDKAEKEVLKFVQRQSFQEEISCLKEKGKENESDGLKNNKEKKPLIKKSSAIYKLDPVKIDGLLYVGGRLKQAPIPDSAKHQIILPKKHHVVELIVRHYHLKSGHSGLEHVLSLIREKFWIVKARMAVKGVLVDCFDCKRRQAPLGEQKMADANCPRSCWPLGRVLDVQGNAKDGFVRRVTVKTKASILQRPIDKIVFLESSSG